MEEKAPQADVGFEKLTGSHATTCLQDRSFQRKSKCESSGGGSSLACSRPYVWVVKMLRAVGKDIRTYVVLIHRAIFRHEQSWWILCRNLTQSNLPMRLSKGAILLLDQEK